MKKIHFTLLLILSSLWGFAQSTYTVQGTVSSPSGPVANQVVVIRYDSLNTSSGFFVDSAITNSIGFYTKTTNLPSGNNFVVAQVSTVGCGIVNTNYLAFSPSLNTQTSNFSICATGGGCNASFTFNPIGPLSFQFINTSSLVNASYNWNFGDGNTSTQSSPSHTYNQAGTYNICLIISAPGCIDTTCIVLTISGSSGCAASFNTLTDSLNSLTKHFINTSPGGSTGSTYYWDFGDGTNSTAFSPSKTYIAPGTYTVTLFRYGFGCSDSSFQSITVVNSGSCNAAFSYTSSPSALTTIQFTSLSTPTGLNHIWYFHDGTTSTQINPVKTYPAFGNYNIYLEVYSPNGSCMDSIFGTIVISSGNPCVASFTSSANPTNPLTINFQNTSIADTNAVYSWNYGDGTTVLGFNPSKTYANPGTYTVCLTVQTATCVDSICQTIVVSGSTAPMVSGTVTIGSPNQTAHPFEVYLIQYDSLAGTLTAIDTFYSTSTPSLLYNYHFNNVAAGAYLIKAALSANNPNFTNYMPTYLGQSLTWSSAATIFVGSGTSSNILNIALITGSNPGGPGFVGGFVSQGANRTTGAALKDHSVLITNTQGDAITHALTDFDGRFEWPSLPFGSYYVWVEVPGKPSVQALVTLDASTPIVDSLQFEVGSNGITLFVDKNMTINDLKLFPNPVQNQFYFSFDCTGMRAANYQIVNSKGQIVDRKELNLNYGCSNNFEVDVNHLANGLYFLKLNADEKTGNIKFIKY